MTLRAGIETARLRALMLKQARGFLGDREILEVDVPFLSEAAVSDPNIESIEARVNVGGNSVHYLHTSPEYAMKKLLAAGFPDIFFLGRVFRDGEAGHRHQPEFTLAEWYRLGFERVDIMRETEDFLANLLGGCTADRDADRISYVDLFNRYCDLDFRHASADDLADLAGAASSLRSALGRDRDAWLDLLMATRITPCLPADRLTTVYHYPKSQAALARLAPDDESVAERFEIYLGDVELANGYVELTEGRELRQRFAADQAQRRDLGRAERPLDEDFMRCHDDGLPACAGVAVGFDRLVMLRAGVTDIRQVYHFPFAEPRGEQHSAE
mgnify:CR=1 FL=1